MEISRLMQYRMLKKEIERQEERLIELKEKEGGHGAIISSMPKGNRIADVTSQLAGRIVDIEASLERDRKELSYITEFIDRLENPEIRLILALKCYDGLSWKEISKKLGYNSEGTPNQKVRRFMNVK